ncbi:MAG: hypothetical protein V1806_02600 [Pseudomonadota bacterium]
MNDKLQALAQEMRDALAEIPKPLRQEEVARQVIIGLLARAVTGMGLIAVPAWKPPRSTRDRIDLVGV